MLKGGLVLIWELDMNLEPTLIPKYLLDRPILAWLAKIGLAGRNWPDSSILT